jgi:hypothetical protein
MKNAIDESNLIALFDQIEVSNDMIFNAVLPLDLAMCYLADIEQLPRNLEAVRPPEVLPVSIQNRTHQTALRSAIYPQYSQDNVLNLPKKNIGALVYFCSFEYAQVVQNYVAENTQLRKAFFEIARAIEPNSHFRAKLLKRLFGDMLVQTLTRHIPIAIDIEKCRFSWRRKQVSVIKLNKEGLIKSVKASNYPEDFKDRAIQALHGADDVFKLSHSRLHPECVTVDSLGTSRLRKAHSPIIVLNTNNQRPDIGTLSQANSLIGIERDKRKNVEYVPLIQGWYVQVRKPIAA